MKVIICIALTVGLVCGCSSTHFARHPGPPRIEINTAGVVHVGADRAAVQVDDVPQYLRAQGVPKGATVALSRSGATDPAIVDQVWNVILNAGWKQGLTIVK